MATTTHPAKKACDERIARHAKRDALTTIAVEHLHLETLEERNMDDLDFSDQGVLNIKAALEAAYEAGRKAGEQQ